MKSYFGTYSPPGTSPVDSTILVFDKRLSIGYKAPDGSHAMVNWLLKEVEASVQPAMQASRVRHQRLPGELMIEGNDAAGFIREMQAEQQKPWYRKSSGREWMRNGLLLLGIAGLLVLLYLLIVPSLAQKLASRVPVKTERQIGDAVYDALSLRQMEDPAASARLNDFFKAMAVPTTYDIRITVINDDVVNAFALPGGRIVVYRGLLQQVRSYPELAALLSHEFTHVNNKHATRRIFRTLGSKVFIGLLFGRFGTVTNVVVNHADNLKNLKYSRSLEKEADTQGLAILLERKIDPKGFTDLFRHLEESSPGSSLPEFLGSHPDIGKRIDYITVASKNANVEEDEGLKAIFEQLK